MKIILTGVEPELVQAWQKFCGDLEDVAVYHGSIFDVQCDAVVSPANSFGFMDGGIDMLYSRRFGWQVQERLQELIQSHHHGELMVGAAEIVETDANIPFLIAAPTMRVPMILRDSVNPYLAARAALSLVKHGFFIPAFTRVRQFAKSFTASHFRVWEPASGKSAPMCAPTKCAPPSKMSFWKSVHSPRTGPKRKPAINNFIQIASAIYSAVKARAGRIEYSILPALVLKPLHQYQSVIPISRDSTHEAAFNSMTKFR